MAILVQSESKSRNMETNSCGTFIALEDRLLCGRPITVNLVSIEVGSAEARAGLMCMQCNSVMKRHTGQDDSSEWERVSDERVELEEEL